MNPVLLKPGSDQRSHVVVMGRPAGEVSSRDFISGRRHLAAAAYDAFDDLASRYDLVVAEGAGSPAEINLRESDYVNMGLARHASIPTVVVGDIDRGGVFAAMFGTVALLSPEDQALVAGFVVNKFRGDSSLLAPGLEELVVADRATGLRCAAVEPLAVAGLRGRAGPGGSSLRRRCAQGGRGDGCRGSATSPTSTRSGWSPTSTSSSSPTRASLADADLVVLPGTRSTVADLEWMRQRGLDGAVLAHAAAGRPVLGICGGCQMLGQTIEDPAGVEGSAGVGGGARPA